MKNQRMTPRAASAPTSCAAINIGTSPGAMPEKLSVNARAIVTAGLAKDVDAVNQYAKADLERFKSEWSKYLRGDLPVKRDDEVTAAIASGWAREQEKLMSEMAGVGARLRHLRKKGLVRLMRGDGSAGTWGIAT